MIQMFMGASKALEVMKKYGIIDGYLTKTFN